MKFSKKRVREIIHEEMQNLREGDGEAEMFKKNLRNISEMAAKVESLYEDNEDIEEWVQEKTAVIEAMLVSIMLNSQDKVRVK